MAGFAAIAISRPLRARLSQHPFSGHVLGVFRNVCNLVDDTGRVIILTSPNVGNGPFSLVVDSDVLQLLELNQPVWANSQCLRIGNRLIDLNQIEVWESQLLHLPLCHPLPEPIASLFRPLVNWPHLKYTKHEPISTQLIQLSQALQSALRMGNRSCTVAPALVGLGRGLTPAGDDYLLGVMAALWLTEHHTLLAELVQVDSSKTTFLSFAFLAAASQGHFIEPWHQLAAAISSAHSTGVAQVLNRISRLGGSSGHDSLTGFASTLLNVGYLCANTAS
ncbi:MAG: DUF2877 domain-containing protein [Chloroflexi bacterium]|nr:DUF2877 domain-containing protein [Chloroflexota bacterium]